MEVIKLLQKFRIASILSRYHKHKTNVFISISPSDKGGGSNTFAYNFRNWLRKNNTDYNIVYDFKKADKLLLIADKADIRAIEKAKSKGCFIIHRLDEHVESEEDDYRMRKHSYIKELNSFADVTVYQSNFVFENMHPFLNHPDKYKIILNGTDPDKFYPCEVPGEYIGHITWGVGDKKRLDIVYETIRENPDEHFLLVGNHSKSKYDFEGLPNVKYAGTVKRQKILSLLHKMKFLFFPSENDPCPNTVVESILSGVPVCFNPMGGTKEIVKDCGLPIDDFRTMISDYPSFRQKCLYRNDLKFDAVARKYLSLN
jgi:glycosyltransferase involved in cell wall biosynthesis